MKKLSALLLIAILLTGCGELGKSPLFSTVTAAPTTAFTPTQWPTFTPGSIKTATPTYTPRPTATLTPTPTVTPIGMITGADDAFSLIPPGGWTVIENTAEKISLVDNLTMLEVQIYAYPTNGEAMDDNLRFNIVMGPLVASFDADKALQVTREQVEKVFFNDGATGRMQPFLLERKLVNTIRMEVIVLGNNFYNLAIISSSDQQSMEKGRDGLDRLVKSVHLRGNEGFTSAETNPGTIRIAVHVPLSGSMERAGLAIKRGAELAMEENKGVLEAMGFKLELTEYNDQGDPEIGVKNAKKIVKDTGVLCVIGHYNSSIEVPSSEIYHAAGLANISPATTDSKVTDRGYREVSRVVGRYDYQGTAAAMFAAKKAIKSAYVINDTTGYGENVALFFQKEAQKQGIKILGFEGTDEKEDFTALLDRVLETKPEAIYFGGSYDQIAVFIKQARQRGFNGMFLTDDNFDSPEAAKIAGSTLLQGNGTFYTVVAGTADWYPQANRFRKKYNSEFGELPLPFAAQSYDATGICLQAIETAVKANGNKMPSRAKVASAVRATTDYPGVTGTINFNQKGDLIAPMYYIVQVTSPDPLLWWDSKPADTIQFKIQ